MLNSGKIICALCDKKKINILTLVLSEKKFLNETKNHNPPFKLNGRSLIRKLLNKGFLVVKLKSSLQKFCYCHHDLVNCY